MEMKDQVCTQVFLALLRIVLIAIILLSALFSLCANSPEDFLDDDGLDSRSKIPLFNFAKIDELAPIACYANIFHHSIPNLTDSLKDKDSASRLFAISFFTINIAYAAIGTFFSK